jgi:hypothetical protein
MAAGNEQPAEELSELVNCSSSIPHQLSERKRKYAIGTIRALPMLSPLALSVWSALLRRLAFSDPTVDGLAPEEQAPAR